MQNTSSWAGAREVEAAGRPANVRIDNSLGRNSPTNSPRGPWPTSDGVPWPPLARRLGYSTDQLNPSSLYQVLAERKSANVPETLLGLHYPATDVPQAGCRDTEISISISIYL